MKPQKAEWFAEEKLTHAIIGAFYYVYNRLGYGFIESVYMAGLERVLIRRGFRVAREVLVPIHLDYEIIHWQRLDMVVEDKVLVEGKVGDGLRRESGPKLLNYLHATTFEIGLLFHFAPKPQFFRLACKNSTKQLANQSNPPSKSV
jgi:GxxExxY protein